MVDELKNNGAHPMIEGPNGKMIPVSRMYNLFAELCERLDRQNAALERIADSLDVLAKRATSGRVAGIRERGL